MSWQPEMDELRRRQEMTKRMGGADKVKRQHDGGRLTVRERIERLLDKDSFREIGSVAGKAEYDGRNDLTDLMPANVVMGRGRIDGRPVAVTGDDFTVRGGSADATIKEKSNFIERYANQYRVPVVRLIEGSGGGGSVKTIETTGRANVPGVSGWEWAVRNMGAVPTVGLGLGSVAGLGAARLAATHYSVMVKEVSAMFVAGPPVVNRLGSKQFDKQELGAADGNEVVAIYAGPTVVARTATGMLDVRAEDVVVATGAAEIHPACPGNDLAGLLTARAAEQAHRTGIDLGRAVAVGTPPVDVPCEPLVGDLLRFLGDDAGRVRAVVTADPGTGAEVETSCDTAIVGLGFQARDVLARMASAGADGTGGAATALRVVGQAADDHPLPPAPTDPTAVVCRCHETTVGDLERAWDQGLRELELLKRATLAGVGTCQGGACLPQVRSWIAQRSGGVVPQPFTARPASRQITIGEAAADVYIDAFRRTPLHDEHLALGARMDRFGGWYRPWHYGDHLAEYWSVRRAVSIGDVSTLGKLVVSGPDVVEFLERLYPCHVADIKPGRSRYALLLNERGHVMDDGMILRDDETRFTLSFTSGGAANAEMWVRDWIDTWGLRVHVLDRTMSLAAINVTGPLAGELLRRAGLAEPPRFMGHARVNVAGVPCHVMRLSFTGEAAWELHHPVDRSVELWRTLLDVGRDLGVRPHGLQALFALRLEKGHVIVGMDTDLDSTPRRLGMDWAVRMEKPRFIGRGALERTAKLPDHRRWMGFTMDGDEPAPVEGSPIWHEDDIVGNVTGSWHSPVLGRTLLLGWQRRTPFVDRVTIDGREAVVAATPFYDPEGHRARA